MFRKLVGIGLFFAGVGLWVILLSVAAFWAIPWLALAYLAGWLSHTREWPELRELYVWRLLRTDYFQFHVVGQELPEPDAKEGPYIYAIYPHGHYSVTATMFWALNPRFVRARAAIHSVLFYVPVFGTFARWIGAIGVTEAEMMTTLQDCKQSIYMCPGGVSDIPNTGNTIKKREGFLRVARAAGAKVVPIWCPQERSYYSQWLPLGYTLESLCFFPVPMLIWGLWWCPLLPRAPEQKSNICVGRTIDPASEGNQAFWAELERLQTSLSAE